MTLSERQKLILKLVTFFGVVMVMGLALYFLFFGNRRPVIVSPGEQTPDTTAGGSGVGLPTANEGQGGTIVDNSGTGSGSLPVSPVASGGVTKTTRLTNATVLSPTSMTNGDVAYFDPNDGRFYSIDDSGNVVNLSEAKFIGAEAVTFSNDAEAAVVEFPDGSQVIYDFQSAQQTTLPSHWEDFSFSASGQAIATKSVGLDPSNRTLVVTSTDGSNTKVVADLGANDDKVDPNWSPDGSILGFSRTGSGGNSFGQNEVYLIGADGKAAGVLIVNGSNFKAAWAPDGRNLLYSVADAGDDYRASLWYADSQGDRTGDTRLRISLKTTVDKCIFASNALAYCAVPTNMPVGGGVTNSLVTAPDNLYSISLPAGRSTLVAIPDVETQMFNLQLSTDGGELYYTDARGRLNVIQLK